MDTTIRADKLLSSLGVASRRNIDVFLKKNKVKADNITINNSGDRVSVKARIYVNGKLLVKPQFAYFKLNKPKGYISTVNDEFGRKNVLSLIKTDLRIFPVGRLDKDTHGLLLLTNDGGLTNKLIHPKEHIPKVYELTIAGRIENKPLDNFRNGIELEDGVTQKAIAQIIFKDSKKTTVKLTIFEGKKRQIRRMCEAQRLNLLDLKRIEFGPVKLGDLKPGEFRNLSGKELSTLKKAH